MKKSILLKITCLILIVILALPLMPVTAQAATAPNGFVMFNQFESQWYNYSFNGGTLAATGCGIFSFANCIGYLTGNTIDVVEVASWAHNNGMFNVYGADGTYRTSFYPRASARYGDTYGFTIDCTSDGSGYWDYVTSWTLKNHLLSGGVAVAHVYGHFIAIVGYDASTNYFHIWDCAPSSRRGTNSNGGDIWLSESYLTSAQYMTVDWFALMHPTKNNKLEGAEPLYLGDNFDAWIRQPATNNYLTDVGGYLFSQPGKFDDTQRWHFIYNSDDGTYSILNDVKNQYLDVPFGKYENNNPIWLCDGNGLDPQRFYIYFIHGYFFFRTKASQKLFDVNSYANNALELCGEDTGISNEICFNARAFEILKFNNDYSHWFYDLGKTNSVFIRNSATGLMMTAEGSSVVFKDATYGDEQRWIMGRRDNGSYEFKSVSTGLYLDVLYGGLTAGTTVDLCEYNGLRPQAFYVLPNEQWSGSYYIKPCYSHTVVHLDGNSRDLTLQELNKAESWAINSQTFEIVMDGIVNNKYQPTYLGDYFEGYLTGKSTGNTLTDMGDYSIKAQPTTYADNQRFRFEYDAATLTYKIIGNSGLCMDVTNTFYNDGSTIGMYNDNGWAAQRFRFYEIDGYVYISPFYTNKLVDIHDGDKSTVQLYGTELADFRAFTLTKAEAIPPAQPDVSEPEVSEPEISVPEVIETELILKDNSYLSKDGSELSGVCEGNTASEIISQFDNVNVSVYNLENNLVSDSEKVGTGYTVKLSVNGEVVDSVTLIMKGDVTGDGIIDATDYLRIKGKFLDTYSFEGVFQKAADVDESTTIDSTDYLKIKGHFLGTDNLFN